MFVGCSDYKRMGSRLIQCLPRGRKICLCAARQKNSELGLGIQKGPPPYGQRLLSQCSLVPPQSKNPVGFRNPGQTVTVSTILGVQPL